MTSLQQTYSNIPRCAEKTEINDLFVPYSTELIQMFIYQKSWDDNIKMKLCWEGPLDKFEYWAWAPRNPPSACAWSSVKPGRAAGWGDNFRSVHHHKWPSSHCHIVCTLLFGTYSANTNYSCYKSEIWLVSNQHYRTPIVCLAGGVEAILLIISRANPQMHQSNYCTKIEFPFKDTSLAYLLFGN